MTSGFDIYTAIENFGAPAVLCAALLWFIRSELKSQREREERERDKQNTIGLQREARLADRLTQVEDFQRNELAVMNKEMVAAMREHSTAMRDLATVIERRDTSRIGS